ncbi:Zinc finger protein [Nesidiocoris tenuis]|uniref:Zinc finger protein n=1 Tax=Nesidiocoris tenuis TaxID=355587 RepID=A0ABN7B6L3_9HEMI|nr:Zinc finger protein [Nesidiocoris tenuis]
MFRIISRSIKSYTVIKPYVNVDVTLREIDYFKEIVNRRKLDVDMDEIAFFYDNLKRLAEVNSRLEAARASISGDIERLGPDGNEDEKRRLVMLAKTAREDHKHVKSSLHDMEQSLIRLMLRVPNVLHPETADHDVISYCSEIPSNSNGCHLEIGKKLGLLDYRSPAAYFLKNEAAEFELESTADLVRTLKSEGYVGFANPDFVREIVLDVCSEANVRSMPLKKFDDDQDVHFVTGGASLLQFLAYFSQTSTAGAQLPLRCYSSGRHYGPVADPAFGLYDVNQTNALQIFTLSDPRDERVEFDLIISKMTDFYKSQSIPFRVVVKKASDLCVAESLRINFELYSPHFKRYFECGHVSIYASKISKVMNIRLLKGKSEFPNIISGTIARVAPLLACILENRKCL